MPFNSSQHGPFTGGVDASSGAFVQPKGTVPRASNLINIAHGALSTCDGSSILAWENGAIQSGDHRIMALEAFQPSGVAPYYLMLKEGNDFPLDAPFNLLITGGTPIAPGTPANIALTVGCNQSTIINTAFGTQISATVTDSSGDPVNDIMVTFTVPALGASGSWGLSGGSVITATTGSNGVATAPTLTANTTPGPFSVTATVSGLASGASCTLTNVTTAQVPTTLMLTAGCGQTTAVNTNFPTLLQATVTDQNGSPMNNITVLFTVPASGASGVFAIGGNTSTANTNTSGVATASTLTANGTPGPFNVTAQTSSLTATGTCTLTNSSGGSPTLTILTTMLPGAVAGNLGEFYSAYVEASGQGGTWAISGLPSYLTWAVANSGGNTALVNISGTPPIQAGPTPPADLGTFNVTISLTSGGATDTVTLPLTVADSSAPVVPATVVPITNFGNVGAGGDDTAIFQQALNSTAAAGQALHIVYNSAHAGIPYNVGPLTIPNGSYLTFDGTVTINATAGYGTNDCMLNVGSNVVISGASTVFDMSLNQVTNTQFRHCCLVDGASNVYISGCTFSQAGGDGIYVANSSHVMFVSCTSNQSYRNGCSVTDNASHIFFERCNFQNTAGTLPQSGVDVEPNGGSASPVDINFYTCNCTGNAIDGFLVSLQNLISSSGVVSIFVQNMHSSNNGGTSGQKYGFGYHLLNAGQGTVNPPGQVWIQNSFSDNSNSYGATARFWAADGVQATFVNLSVTNPNLGGPDFDYGDKSAVTVIRGGGESTPLGNARFGVYFAAPAPGPYTLPGVSISAQTSPTALTDYYFNINDGSGQTLEHITIELESISGATKPNGDNGKINGTGTTATSVVIP